MFSTLIPQMAGANTAERVELLAELVDYIRPRDPDKPAEANNQLRFLIAMLRADPAMRSTLHDVLADVLLNHSHTSLHTQVGVQGGMGFFGELQRRMVARWLPELGVQSDLSYVLQRLFWQRSDARWVSGLDRDVLAEVLELLSLPLAQYPRVYLRLTEQFCNALTILSYRITVVGLEPSLVSKRPELDNLNSPFFTQNQWINADYGARKRYAPLLRKPGPHLRNVHECLGRCAALVAEMRQRKTVYGTSLSLTFMLQRLGENVRRVQTLLRLMHEHRPAARRVLALQYFQELVAGHCAQSSVRQLIQRNVDTLLFQVVENAARTGEHYITQSRKEYNKMFRKAVVGGAIVSLIALCKTLLYFLKLAPFGQTFMYGLNYAVGFTGIYLSGGTLATKQPAMTASRIAQVFENHRNDRSGSLASLVLLISRVSRTQFIAVLGNVIIALPLGVLIAGLWYLIFGSHLAYPEKSQRMLLELHPFLSPAVLHAGIAGIWLFVSGLVSGYWDNLIVFHRIPERLRAHRKLLGWLGPRRLDTLVRFVDLKSSGIVGNVVFGFLLGFTPLIGWLFGLDLDIRHVTFAAANLGMAAVGAGLALTPLEWFMSLLGVMLIGLTNLIVSFGLAFTLATKSRGLKLRDYPSLIQLLVKHFLRHPLSFYFPPKPAVPKALGAIATQPSLKTLAQADAHLAQSDSPPDSPAQPYQPDTAVADIAAVIAAAEHNPPPLPEADDMPEDLGQAAEDAELEAELMEEAARHTGETKH
jgi:site-specific recombinase